MVRKIMKESTIEGRLVRSAKQAGWLALKFVSPGNAGVPDRMLISPEGRIIFVELKTETGRLSKMQKAQIERLRRHGQDVRVLYGSGDVDALLREVMQIDIHPT